MRKHRNSIIIVIVLLALTGLGVYKLMDNKKVVQSRVVKNDPNKPYAVKTYTLGDTSFIQNLSAIGTFEPVREVMIMSQSNGQVLFLDIELGAQVRKGQVLARLDNDIVSAQYEAAKANYENSKSNLERYERAGQSEGIPQIQIDQARLGVRSAESQMKILSKQLANTTIVAPFDGVITEKNIELGTTLSPNGRVATLTDITSLKLTVSLPEKDIVKFKKGDNIDVTADLYPGETYKGKVVAVAAKGDRAHNYQVQIEVQNPKDAPLKAGMYGSVASSSTGSALLIPKNALVGSEKQPQVYLVKDGKAVITDVVISSSNNDFYTIGGGLKAGDQVITSGQINLDNNTPVTVDNN